MTIKDLRVFTVLFFILFTAGANAQNEVFYQPKLPQIEKSVAKKNLERVLKVTYFLNKKNTHVNPEIVTVFDNKFEITLKKEPIKTIYFSDFHDHTIYVFRSKVLNSEELLGYVTFSDVVVIGNYYFYNFTKSSVDNQIKELADYLFYFQYQLLVQRYDSLIAIFKPLAAQYRTLQVKPSISEEQRKYVVQANSFAQEKQYAKAINLYNETIKLDQTSYPAAYSNLALLHAQYDKYSTAIYYMKKYLLLEPEAADARSCQDKIYEWEAKIGK
ncbi:MAG: tetratricopeptide repeat protein [Ignavibacteriaceae bacterium]|jgi:tetratricopeptide (TPR) repeat protein|nr:tetratricopeptide repeat protein [Ignavibacteriaceae bacterium]